jgi:hypothetical protein
MNPNQILIKVIAIYQLARGIFGQSLVVFPIDILFRLLLCLGGILVFTNRRIGYVLLVITIILSIPQIQIEEYSSISSFYWPPVRFILPANIGFALYGQESISSAGVSRIVIDGIYVILLIALWWGDKRARR